MKYKRILSLILTGVLTAGVFAGCDDKKESENNTQNTSSSASKTDSSGGYTGNEVSQKDIVRIYQLYGSVGCIYLCEKNNIALDKEYKESVAAEAKEFISGLDIGIIGTSDLVKVICTDNVLSLGMNDKLRKELYERYNADAKLFDEYKKDDYKDIDSEMKTAMQMTSTDAVWMQLNAFGLKDEKYDVKKMLSDAFNANTDKYDHNVIYNNTLTITSELENIFYYYLITDSLDSIEYKPIWDVLGPGYQRDIFETNENKDNFKEKSINNISGILTDIKAKDVLKVDIKPKYGIQEYFDSLSGESAFEYDTTKDENIYYEYTLFVNLSQPKDLKLSDNKFFTENVGKWLKYCYNNNHKMMQNSN